MTGRIAFIAAGLFAAGTLCSVDLANAQSRPGDRSPADSGSRVEFAAGTLNPRNSGRSVSPRAKMNNETGLDVGSPESTPRICTNCDD